MSTEKGGYLKFSHEPRSFVVHAFTAIDEEIIRRHPNETELERLKKEPLLNLALFAMGGPYVLAYCAEKFAVEIADMGNEVLIAGIDSLKRP